MGLPALNDRDMLVVYRLRLRMAGVARPQLVARLADTDETDADGRVPSRVSSSALTIRSIRHAAGGMPPTAQIYREGSRMCAAHHILIVGSVRHRRCIRLCG